MKVVFCVKQNDLGLHSSPSVKWSRNSKFLAMFGNNNSVSIFDKNGNKIVNIPVANPALMDWDSDSHLIAISSSSNHDIILFNLHTNEISTIEAPFIPTWISFAKSGSFLAAGSDKGKFWIWDKQTEQSQTYQGTHCNKIIDGGWNTKKQLVLCSEDHSISISSVRGEIIARYEIDDVPCFPHFVKIDNQLSLIFSSLSKPVVYIWEYNNGDKVTKIPFSKDFGKIIKCRTLSNGYIYVQFASGRFALVDFNGSIVVERQVFPSIALKADILQSKSLVCSRSSMKLVSMSDISNITDEQISFSSDATGDVCNCLLSPDGIFGAVGFTSGIVLVYLVEAQILAASRGPYSVYTDSLTTLTVCDMHKKKHRKIQVDVQPQLLDICSSKLAVAFNNKGWFYNIEDGSLITSVEFSSSIDAIQVSESSFAVLTQSKLMLNYFDKSKKSFVYPDFDTNLKVTAFSLTNFLLLIATDDGKIVMFHTHNQKFLKGYQHPYPIVSITPNISETRFVLIDSQNEVFLFYPVKLKVLEVTGKATKINANFALFDILDRNVFAVIGSKQASLYHFTSQSVNGPRLRQLCSVNINSMKTSIGLSNGSLIYLDGQSSEQSLIFPSHNNIDEKSEKAVHQLLNLYRHRKALQVALDLKDKKLIHEVGEQSLSALKIEIASNAFSQSEDAAIWNVIQPLFNECECSYMCGYISMIDHDFNAAQKNFLNSTRPQMALDMRAALFQFDQALKLAENLDPARIMQLSYDSARQNELAGKYSLALEQYKESSKSKKLAHLSHAGYVRCLFLTGKVERGMQHLSKTRDSKLINECAQILEEIAAFKEAAQLYMRVNEFNKAAQCNINAGELKLASELVQKVTDIKILRSIGHQLERQGQLETSTIAFEKANDYESLVRVLLKVNLDRATKIARQHPEERICRLVAQHCIQLGNYKYAIEFLIRSGHSEDAIRIAELHDRMDELADLIGENGTSMQYEEIANYFCSRSLMIQAAKFFKLAGDSQRAMNCYMADGSDSAIDAALTLAESESDSQLREELLEYLTVNKSKDLKYLLRMFIIMKQFNEASQTALNVADELRNRGEYKSCRDVLFDVICQLKKRNFPVSSELRQSLIFIHSYLLVNQHKNDKNKKICALLLKRLSKNVSKFPVHAANLLVMAVVYCTKAGMKKSAYDIAVKVLQPEFQGKIKNDILKKIQTTVRKKNISEEIDEDKSPCPGCGVDLPISQLYCGNCKLNLHFDSFTGMHMVREDWCECPNCNFTCSFNLLVHNNICPMCNAKVENPQLITNFDENSFQGI